MSADFGADARATPAHSLDGPSGDTGRVGAHPSRLRPLFRVTRFADIEIEQHKHWLIDDLLGAGEATAFYGPPGCGKSVLLGDAAAHVAAGLPWFGRPVRCGLVVYIAAERGALVKRRLAAWRKRYGIEDIALIVVESVFDFCSNTTGAAEIVRIAAEAAKLYEVPVAWVIIDTKSQVMAGADPNSDSDTMKLMKSVAVMQRDTGAHVTIVDHVPHYAPERLKGSGALAGAVDGSFLVSKVSRGHHRVTIGSKPPNDGPDELDLAFSLERVAVATNPDGKVTWAPVVVPSDIPSPLKPAKTAKPRLKPAGAKIVAAFNRLFDAGQTHATPSAAGVQPGTLAVLMADLREEAFRQNIYPYPEPKEPSDPKERTRWRNGRNAAWKRGVEEVERHKALTFEGGFVWDPWRAKAVTNGDNTGDQW